MVWCFFAKASQQIMAVPLMFDLIIAWHNGNIWFNPGLQGRCWRRVATKNPQQKPMEAVITQLDDIIIGNKSPSRIHFPPPTAPNVSVCRGGNMLSSHLHLVRQSDVEQFKAERGFSLMMFKDLDLASGLVEASGFFCRCFLLNLFLVWFTGGLKRTQFQA